MNQHEITQSSITRVLVIGFSAVIVLLVFGGSIAVRNIISIQENAAKLVHEQSVTQRLIEDLENEQKTLSAIFYTVTGDPDTANAENIQRRLEQVEQSLVNIQKEAKPDATQLGLWNELLHASDSFEQEAKRLLTEPDSLGTGSRDLFRRHEQVIRLISQLVGEGFRRVKSAEIEIQGRADKFNHQSLSLLLASLALALVSSVFTVRMTRQLFRNMAWQESELTRVSWQMLSSQESIARRFSHELHDEMGQTLAALKGNLGAFRPPPDQAKRLQDSMKLVDDAIRNVRQLSQLLRPMILDDFGLDAGLNWLCEGFMQRTGIEVDYSSNLRSRLPDETETHLFRIAQEALTNVARHAGATSVSVKLTLEDQQIRLVILDNGKGLQPGGDGSPTMGMTSMRARARAVGGMFEAENAPEGGLRLEALVPRPNEDFNSEPEYGMATRMEANDKQNSNPVG